MPPAELQVFVRAKVAGTPSTHFNKDIDGHINVK
jgi:hypothetical protein